MKLYLFRKIIAVCFLLGPLFLFSSCEDALRGHGDTVSRTRPVADFTAIDVEGNFEVFLTQGPTQDIQLEGQENVLTQIATRVRNNELHIEFEKKRVKIHNPVRIYLTTPNLNKIAVSGSNAVRTVNTWKVDNLSLRASGSSNLNLNLTGANNIQSRTSGSVDMVLNGDANNFDADISGSGKIKAYNLITKTADIKVSGSGRCELTVETRLKTDISGSGKVNYKGNPSVETKISGSGSVTKVD